MMNILVAEYLSTVQSILSGYLSTELLQSFILVGLQALYAACLEEEIALTADKHGVRDSDGQFRSIYYAIGRSIAGFCGIAIAVGIIPILVNKFITHFYVQTIPLLVIGSTLLVNIVVDKWKINKRDYFIFTACILVIVSPILINTLTKYI
jgi:hypothetical protein